MVNQVICDRSVGQGSAWAAIAGSRTTRSHCRAGSAGEPCARARIRKAVSGATFPPAASSSTSSQGCHQAKQAGGIFTTPASHRCGWARDRRRASGKRWLSFVQRIVMHPADSTCGTSAIYVPLTRISVLHFGTAASTAVATHHRCGNQILNRCRRFRQGRRPGVSRWSVLAVFLSSGRIRSPGPATPSRDSPSN